ncbi:MAG: DHH family phosphoesterase [Solirubrobacterales bacterium]
MTMNNIIEAIKQSSEIAITFHISPDGDSLGSALGLREALISLGKNVYIMSKEPVPYNLSFLPNCEIIDGSTFKVLPSTNLVIVLDCGDYKRINAEIDKDNKAYTLINIDHHLSNEQYGDLNYVDPSCSSIGEIMYTFLEKLEVKITQTIAACLYTSIISDTGSFRYSSTTSLTHNIAGKLIDTGIDFSRIHRNVFDDKQFSMIKFLGRAIDNMKLVSDKICLIKIKNSDFLDFEVDPTVDTAHIIALGLEVKSVEVAVLLKESQDKIKVSLRSKDNADVRSIAEKFDGGGHKKAAGLTINNMTIDEAEKLILEEIEKELIK